MVHKSVTGSTGLRALQFTIGAATSSTLILAMFATSAPASSPEDVTEEVREARTAIARVQASDRGQVVDGVDAPVRADGTVVVEGQHGGVIRVPSAASEEVEVLTESGESISFSIPGRAPAVHTTIGAGSASVFVDSGDISSTVVPGESGEVQILTTIGAAHSRERFSYDFALPDHASMTVDSGSGAVIARDSRGGFLFGIAPPWAVDAAGTAVPTRFEVEGTTVTQVVEHGSRRFAYPVVADPTVDSSMIKSYKWHKSSKGWTISVAVTPWMGWVTITAAAGDGWNELTRAVKKKSATEYKRLKTTAMQQQWNCHAAGKGVIGLMGWVGWDGRPTWDLETWRKPLNGDVVKMVGSLCNW